MWGWDEDTEPESSSSQIQGFRHARRMVPFPTESTHMKRAFKQRVCVLSTCGMPKVSGGHPGGGIQYGQNGRLNVTDDR